MEAGGVFNDARDENIIAILEDIKESVRPACLLGSSKQRLSWVWLSGSTLAWQFFGTGLFRRLETMTALGGTLWRKPL